VQGRVFMTLMRVQATLLPHMRMVVLMLAHADLPFAPLQDSPRQNDSAGSCGPSMARGGNAPLWSVCSILRCICAIST
jgi:hypothetical protein